MTQFDSKLDKVCKDMLAELEAYAEKQQPMLMESPLTKRIYVVTSYEHLDGGKFLAHEKFDVTEQFEALAKARQEVGDE